MADVGALVFVLFVIIAAVVLLPWSKLTDPTPKNVQSSAANGVLDGEDLGPTKPEEFPELEIDTDWSEQTVHTQEKT